MRWFPVARRAKRILSAGGFLLYVNCSQVLRKLFGYSRSQKVCKFLTNPDPKFVAAASHCRNPQWQNNSSFLLYRLQNFLMESGYLFRLFLLLTGLALIVFVFNVFRPLIATTVNYHQVNLVKIVKQVRYSIPESLGGKRRRIGLNTTGPYLTLNGRAFQIFSGSIHYFRVPHGYWKDRLIKLKAAGLNTVETYIPWNLHERQKGKFDFTNEEYDLSLVEFINTAHSLNLYVIVRPGPYICTELDWGGLPAWLLEDPEMVVRSIYKRFTEHVTAYLNRLSDELVPLFYSNEGPIIAVQIENEYGSYGTDGEYLKWLKQQFIASGLNEGLFTSDGSLEMYRGAIPGVFATVNFDIEANAHFQRLMKLRPNQALMNMEFYAGWFDHWGERHHRVNSTAFKQRLRATLQWTNASVNIYMFHGGTNFGFMNGANRKYKFSDSDVYIYQPTITSYDYDAVVSESGQVTKKWYEAYELMTGFNTHFNPSSGTYPKSSPPISYNKAPVEKYLLLSSMLVDLPSVKVRSPVYMEEVCGAAAASKSSRELETESLKDSEPSNCVTQTFGFIAYRRNIITSETNAHKRLRIQGFIRDRALVIVDGKTSTYTNILAENFEVTSIPKNLEVNLINDGRSVEVIILVENMGRVGYEKIPRKLDDQRKGFSGKVFYGEEEKFGWDVFKLEFDREFFTKMAFSNSWLEHGHWTKPSQPALFAGTLLAGEDGAPPQDTFVETKKWNKGSMFINGFNLGRYWTIGPQWTLYLPAPRLKPGKNEIMAFELHNNNHEFSFTSRPVLGAYHEDIQ